MQATATVPFATAIAVPPREDPYLAAAKIFQICEDQLCKMPIDTEYLESMRNFCRYGKEACTKRWPSSIKHAYMCLRAGLEIGEKKGLFTFCQNPPTADRLLGKA